jgi:copper(I)-binding protein
MKRFIPIILIAIVLLSACGPEKGIEVHSAWMRPAAAGGNGGVYFELHNHSSTPDELMGVSSDAAVVAEIHESKLEGDVMSMNMLTSLPLEANADIAFEPGGLHVMLVNLRQDYKMDDEFTVTLHFKNGEDVTVHVIVRDFAPEEEEHTDM